MSASTLKKLLAALMLILAAALYVQKRVSPGDLFTPGILGFGLLNVLFAPPGTTEVRMIAIVGAMGALLDPGFNKLVAGLAWVLWPPAFLATWALARVPGQNGTERDLDAAASKAARIKVSALILAIAIASFAYRLILQHGMAQTAALFVGIPALLAIVVVFEVSPQSGTGVACKAVTVGLLVSLLVLGEGMVCVLMSAPIFYGIAIAVALPVDQARKRRSKPSPTSTSFLALLVIGPMALEGVTPLMSLDRNESVTVTKTVHATPAEIERAIMSAPRFDRPLPLYLRIGFPRAIASRIEANPATRWVIEVRGGEMRLNGIEPRTGELVLDLEERRPGHMRWRAIADTSHMTHFLRLEESDVAWTAAGGGTTSVTWTLRYRRDLDPAWYFGPMERYAMTRAADYLIDAVATP